MDESELAVGIAMLLFIGAFSLSWRTMESIFFFILGLAAAVGSTLLGLVFMMLGLGLTRNAARRELYFNKVMLPTFCVVKFLLFCSKQLVTKQSDFDPSISRQAGSNN